jgi:hypothetical protein
MPEARRELREKVKAARTKAAEGVAPKARLLLDMLDAAQRAVLERRAARHGKTLDRPTGRHPSRPARSR